MVPGSMTVYNNFHIRTPQGGFGLIELLVSIGILLLITSLVMVRHSSFNQTVLVENQAYEVAFDIRQTQIRAVSPQVGATGDIRGGYGIRFLGDTNNRYEIFQLTQSGVVVVETVQLDNRFQFSVSGAGNADTIFFSRPDFDARFIANNDFGNPLAADQLNITISATDPAPNQSSRVVTVTNTGQVTISRSSNE